MIEVSCENIYYKKRPKRRRFLNFIILILIVSLTICYYKFAITNTIIDVTSSYAYSYSTDAVNNAILDNLKEEIKYNDLINLEKNDLGEIELITVNAFKANKINKEITLQTSELLKKKIDNGIPLPIMAFSGIKFLSGYGREVNFKAIGVSSVESDFVSEFKSVGINQTLHSIYVNVICKLEISMTFSKEIIECDTSVLLTETILVGKVPETYLNGNLFNN